MAWYNKGNAFDDLGKYDEAIKCYNEAIRLNPSDSAAWSNKGVALLARASTMRPSNATMKLSGWIQTMLQPGTTKVLLSMH